MKTIASITLAATVLCAAAETKPEKKRLTPEERRAIHEARIAEQGGFVQRPIKGPVVQIRLETSRISPKDLEEASVMMRRRLSVAIEISAKGEPSKHEVGAYVLLADQGEKVPMMLCAPEENWATVNVTRLLAGDPDAETLKARIIKETWRALAYALGACNSQMQPCVLRPIRKAADLDREKVMMVTPGPVMSMRSTIHEMGFSPGGYVTYKKACEEGWAPAPTNDVQKAVWDKVHAVPSDPMKIEFDPKKGK